MGKNSPFLHERGTFNQTPRSCYLLFPEEQTRLKLTEAMDKVNNHHGDFTVVFGSLLN